VVSDVVDGGKILYSYDKRDYAEAAAGASGLAYSKFVEKFIKGGEIGGRIAGFAGMVGEKVSHWYYSSLTPPQTKPSGQ
jgi:hypothetical protein